MRRAVAGVILFSWFSGCASLGSADQIPEGVVVKTHSIRTIDNKRIQLDQYLAGHSQVIILAHGFYNSKKAVLFKEMAAGLLEDSDVIVFDFRGHGQSSGLFTWTVNEHRDLQAVLDFAERNYERIGVIGFSLGAAISLLTAARDSRIHSLIAVSPPYDFNHINYQFWKMGVMENIVYNVFQEGRTGKGIRPGWPWHKKTKPIDVVDRIHIPILFVHGEKDWLIVPEHSRQLFRKATKPKELVVIKGATHAEYIFRGDKEGTLKLFKKWFRKTLDPRER